VSHRLTFWGTRGSIPTPGPQTMRYGGNTACISITGSDGRLVILDAGSGLRPLGHELMSARGRTLAADILLSHTHWDHIQGLPFFVPAYLPSTKLTIAGTANGVMSLGDALSHQMTAPVFPVRLDELGAQLQLREIKNGERFDVGEATVRVAKLNHPGGVQAYRIEHEGKSIVYATDTEHYACVDPALRALAEGADVLIYDAQYTPEEYRGDHGRSKVGWGHSTYVAGAELARAAGVGRLVLFHHDPQRTDAGVLDIERRARDLFAPSVAAREGMELGFDAMAQAA
jgi:phosphoribosyl 1,2-cyclic phosphodiesterase